MKTKLLYLVLTSLLSVSVYGQFQTNFGPLNGYCHDINLDELNDGQNNFVIASNIFDAPFTTQSLSLSRLDQSGTIVWSNTYTVPGLLNLRQLDVVNYLDLIYVTGSVDINGPGTRSVFIAEFLATTGAFLNANFYDFLTPPVNSQGLKIIHTDSDADGDGLPDPGFVVTGYFSPCAPTNTTCPNTGFVLRVDSGLNPIWIIELDNLTTTNGILDYDFINGIVETPTGFFLTGSVTGGILGTTIDQQAVLAHKIDFLGNTIWDSSYVFGNSQDISVDAKYDAASNQIYMLCNYSQTHYFGVTLLDDITGVINPSSWYLTDPDADRYGFTLDESITSANNYVVAGYDRDETWRDAAGNLITSQSNIFLYEFDKVTGAQVGQLVQYLVSHIEHSPEEFSFWTGQLPLLYYPDMSLLYTNNDGTGTYYYNVGYRTVASGETATEYLSVDATLQNICVNIKRTIPLTPLQWTPVQTSTAQLPVSFGPIPINVTPLVNQERICDDTLGLSDNSKPSSILYPNPASDVVYISGAELAKYRIIDALGRTISEGIIDPDGAVNLEHLKIGLYFITAYDLNNRAETFKIIKK